MSERRNRGRLLCRPCTDGRHADPSRRHYLASGPRCACSCSSTTRLRGTTAEGNQYATCVPEDISDESRRVIEAVVDAAVRKMEADRE